MRPVEGGPDCRCGHTAYAHEHYRAGSDCALCDCVIYRSTVRARIRAWVSR